MSTSAVPTVVGFAATLRAAGVAASHDRVQAFVRALDALDATNRDALYWAGRVTLCGRRDDLDRYDRVFAAYFGGLDAGAVRRPRPRMTVVGGPTASAVPPDEAAEDHETAALQARASRSEVLRRKDVATLSEDERRDVARLMSALSLSGEQRRTRRWQPCRRGRVDRDATVRRMLRTAGEPARLQHRRHRARPRRVVLLIDVSGSMSPYADALMRFAHATARGRGGVGSPRTEIFTVGTRLTRVTRELSHRDPDVALAAAGDAVPDWSGGTRLGDLLKAFLDRWGQRGTARGAVVVLLSDGWERGDPTLLGAQMERLSRLAHRTVWANPRKARPGYAPLAAGMAAALPYIDDFVAGHSLEALEHLARVVAGAADSNRQPQRHARRHAQGGVPA